MQFKGALLYGTSVNDASDYGSVFLLDAETMGSTTPWH